MGVRTAKITKITSKMTKNLPIVCRNLGRVLIPALTTRFKTKNWAAFRLAFLCFLERFLQAEYRFFRFLGFWPFGRMTPPATLFEVIVAVLTPLGHDFVAQLLLQDSKPKNGQRSALYF